MPVARTLIKILTLRCREATELISAAGDENPPGLGDRLAVRLHTLICGPCRRFRTQLGRVRQWLRDGESIANAGAGAGLSDDARRRLERLVQESP